MKYDNGGLFKPGAVWIGNDTGKPERVTEPKEHWWQFPKLAASRAIGLARGPWVVLTKSTRESVGIRFELDPFGGLSFTSSAFGRGLIVGWMPVKPWRIKEREFSIGREVRP